MAETNWNPEREAEYLKQLEPVLKGCMDDVKGRLPAGTDFGILIYVPGEPEARVIATSTDRDKFVLHAAQYVMNMVNSGVVEL